MKNQMQNFEETYEAKNEEPVAASEIVKEIMPLLEDYFVGDFLFDGEAVTYVLPNNQRFSISAKEIV